jgi:hypothetical protein
MGIRFDLRSWARLVDTDTAHFLTGSAISPSERRRRYYASCGQWLSVDQLRKIDRKEAERYEVVACANCEDACGQDIFGHDIPE